MNRFGIPSVKRAALMAGATVTALGAIVGLGAGTASAIATHLTSTSVSCAPGSTYYGTATCTVTVTDLYVHTLPFTGYPSPPTGTASIASITGRLPSGSCTLVAVPASTNKSKCDIVLSPKDTGPMIPLASYSATGGVHISSILPVAGSLTVGPAPLVITADPQSRDYGAADPTFTVSYATFVNSETSSVLGGSLSCTTTATSTSDVNTYPISCSGLTSPLSSIYPLSSTPHYSISWVDGTLTVEKADLTITADDQSRGYGEANPTFTASYASFVPGDDENDLDDPVVCTTTADSSSPAGDYPITCSAGADNNYDLHFIDGNLHIGTATLDITADDKSRVVGAANPTFTVKYATFQGTDDEGDLGGTLECTTTADSNSPVGDYPITCSGLTSDNYAINFVAGTLHVLAAPGGSLPGGSGAYQAGGTVEIDVHDFEPGTTVLVNGCGIVDGEILIDSNGLGHGSFTLPAGMETTTCKLTLTGKDHLDDPAEISMTMEVLGLVPTGGNTMPLGVAAGLAIMLGFGLVLLGRRRYAVR